jgi:hypothetical protein
LEPIPVPAAARTVKRYVMRIKRVNQSAQAGESSITTATVFAQVLDHLNLNGAMHSKLVSQSALVVESWMTIVNVFAQVLDHLNLNGVSHKTLVLQNARVEES